VHAIGFHLLGIAHRLDRHPFVDPVVNPLAKPLLEAHDFPNFARALELVTKVVFGLFLRRRLSVRLPP